MSTFAWAVIGMLLTVMVISYLAGDNFFFRLAVYLFVGISAGYLAVLLIYRVIVPHMLAPLWTGAPGMRLLAVIPLVLGGLMLAALFQKSKNLARLPLAILIGVGSAVLISGILLGTLLPQIVSVVDRFDFSMTAVGASDVPWMRVVDALIILIGVITTLIYFYNNGRNATEKPQKLDGFLRVLGKAGQVFIGVTLGALFAGVYAAALTALIERAATIWDFIRSLLHY